MEHNFVLKHVERLNNIDFNNYVCNNCRLIKSISIKRIDDIQYLDEVRRNVYKDWKTTPFQSCSSRIMKQILE